jgi:hypothetical protein
VGDLLYHIEHNIEFVACEGLINGILCVTSSSNIFYWTPEGEAEKFTLNKVMKLDKELLLMKKTENDQVVMVFKKGEIRLVREKLGGLEICE